MDESTDTTRKKKLTEAEMLEVAKTMGFNYLSRLECPDRGNFHAEGWLPKDFNPTTGLSKTHRQERCPTCGYWSLWTPKQPAVIDGPDDDGLCTDETPCGNCSRPDPPALIDGLAESDGGLADA